MDALSAKRSKRSPYADGMVGSSDEASFSPFAVELARIGAELRNVPDVRDDLVDDLKAQVDAGTYSPPLAKVASALLVAGILDVD